MAPTKQVDDLLDQMKGHIAKAGFKALSRDHGSQKNRGIFWNSGMDSLFCCFFLKGGGGGWSFIFFVLGDFLLFQEIQWSRYLSWLKPWRILEPSPQKSPKKIKGGNVFFFLTMSQPSQPWNMVHETWTFGCLDSFFSWTFDVVFLLLGNVRIIHPTTSFQQQNPAFRNKNPMPSDAICQDAGVQPMGGSEEAIAEPRPFFFRGQLMVNCWFGSRWFGFLESP